MKFSDATRGVSYKLLIRAVFFSICNYFALSYRLTNVAPLC